MKNLFFILLIFQISCNNKKENIELPPAEFSPQNHPEYTAYDSTEVNKLEKRISVLEKENSELTQQRDLLLNQMSKTKKKSEMERLSEKYPSPLNSENAEKSEWGINIEPSKDHFRKYDKQQP